MATRVAIVADYPESSDRVDGGVEAVTSYLVDAMARFADIEVHVVTFKEGIDGVEVVEQENCVRHSIPYARFGSLTGLLGDQLALNARLADIRPDVVHSQGGGHHGIVAKRSGYPTVVTIHGIPSLEGVSRTGFRRRIRARVRGWFGEHYSIRRASHTILISPYVADYYGSKLSGKRYLIPNPVHQRFFDVVRREMPGRVLFAGRLYARKGVRDLLRAVAMISKPGDIEIVLAGSLSDKRHVSELTSEAARLGLTNAVHFRGILGKQELLDELSRCSCLVLPSYQETAPMIIQEAMAAGLPVIATDICGIPYQVEDGRSGSLFSPGDVESLADKLNALLSSKALRERYSGAARLRAEAEYRASTVAEKTIDVYRDMLQ
jgi:glycosyltransferase involved in cell wall biosynthesis